MATAVQVCRETIEALRLNEGEPSAAAVKLRIKKGLEAYHKSINFRSSGYSYIEHQIRLAGEELKTRSLYNMLRVLEKKPGAAHPSAVAIMMDVEDFRTQVREMELKPAQAEVFYEHVSAFARPGLIRCGLSENQAAALLIPGPDAAERPAKTPAAMIPAKIL